MPFKVDFDKINTDNNARFLPFFNVKEDFMGIVECLSDIRFVPKKGNMKSDIHVVDVRIIDGSQTISEEHILDGKKIIEKKTQIYKNQEVTLVLNKAVLLSKFKRLQDELKSLTGVKVVIVGLGQAKNKNYLDFYVETYERAVQSGVISPL